MKGWERREGGREGRGNSLTLWEVLQDAGDAGLGEQENVTVSLGPHCATAGDIMNQVDLGRERERTEGRDKRKERGRIERTNRVYK